MADRTITIHEDEVSTIIIEDVSQNNICRTHTVQITPPIDTVPVILKTAYGNASSSKHSVTPIGRNSTDSFFSKQKSALPEYAKQCKFEWNNLNVYVGHDETGKHILHNFNGSIQSGELLAVMGGSGAGKSTLLNALSGRTNLNRQKVKGSLAINGHKFKCSAQDIIKSICTFVPQSDILCPTQTVEEALMFYAHLKLNHLSAAHRRKRINYLIHVLHLESCRNNLIGDEKKRGISGGEKRRVSIASEILNDVDIIFLDEPTSGLDAYTAARTIKTLKQLAAVSNKIIIATIHQPSMEVFYLFDKLMLLSQGKLCFNSDVDDIEIFFKNTLRPKTNPADVIVFDVQKNTETYAKKWQHSSLNMHKSNAIQWETYADLNIDEICIKTNDNMAPRRVQYLLLLSRELKALIRNRRLSIIRVAQLLFFALASGACYFDIRETFEERIRAIFLLILVVLLFGIVSLLTAFPKQKLLFEREYNSRTYNILSWSLTIFMIELPREIIHMVFFTAITYFMIGFDGNVVYFWFTFFLTTITGGSFGMLFGTLCKTAVEASQSVPAALLPLLIFSDALIPVQNLPQFLQWIAAINPLYYLFRCFYIIEFYGVVYQRNLSEDEEDLCNSYQDFLYQRNETADINRGILRNHSLPTSPGLNSSDSVLFDANDVDVPPNNYYNPVFITTADRNLTQTVANFNQTVANFNQTTANFTAQQQKADHYCSEEVSYKYFFDRKHLEASALNRYLLIVLSICVILRLISIVILWLKNNNGISCLCNRGRCCSWNRDRRVEDADADDVKYASCGSPSDISTSSSATTETGDGEEENV